LRVKISMVTMVWVVQSNLGLRPLLVVHIHVSPSTSSGQRNRASWAFQSQKSVTLQPQPGRREITKSIRDMWWPGGRGEAFISNRTLDFLSNHKTTLFTFCWIFKASGSSLSDLMYLRFMTCSGKNTVTRYIVRIVVLSVMFILSYNFFSILIY
jgi:hypothetical protein